jgi:hypothetical protein
MPAFCRDAIGRDGTHLASRPRSHPSSWLPRCREVFRGEALGEPAIDWDEQVTALSPFTAISPQPGKLTAARSSAIFASWRSAISIERLKEASAPALSDREIASRSSPSMRSNSASQYRESVRARRSRADPGPHRAAFCLEAHRSPDGTYRLAAPGYTARKPQRRSSDMLRSLAAFPRIAASISQRWLAPNR